MNDIMAPNEDMERMQSCSINDYCRLCANPDDNMVPIYSDDGDDHMLEDKIKTHLPFINISQNDLLPKRICYHCASAVLVWNELHKSSSEADRKLRSMFDISSFDQNQDKSDVSYTNIEGIPESVKNFIGDPIEYEEITDVSIFNKNEKSDKTLNELDKTIRTSKTDSILNHEHKSSVIQEDEQLNSPIKRDIDDIFGGADDDDDSVDHNMYLNAVGMDDDINGLMNCHRLDMSTEDDGILVVPKREYIEGDGDDDENMDVHEEQQTAGLKDEDDDDDMCDMDDDDHDLHHLQHEQDVRKELLELQQQRMQQHSQRTCYQQQQPSDRRTRQRQHHRDHVGDVDFGDGSNGGGGVATADCNDEETTYGSHISSSLVDGDDSTTGHDVDRLLKCEFDVDDAATATTTNSDYGRRRSSRRNVASRHNVSSDEDDDDHHHRRRRLRHHHRHDGDDDDEDDDDADEDDDEDDDYEDDDDDDNDSAVVDDCSPPPTQQQQQQHHHIQQQQHHHLQQQQQHHLQQQQQHHLQQQPVPAVEQLENGLFVAASPERNEKMCQICATVFKTRYNLVRHMRKRHPEADKYECDLCRIPFQFFDEFKEHLEQKHSKVHQTTHAAVESKQARFACDVCGHMYKNKASVMNHLLTHTAKKSVRCPHCDFTCYTKQQLGVHQTKHDKRFVCNICHKRFAQKSQLDVHINAVHYNQRPFACVLCNKTFKTKGSHDAHMIVHTDTRNYPCPHCDKKCRKRYDLTLHIRTHTGEKPFKCSVCGRGFVQMCDTRKHEMLHFKPGKKKNLFYSSPDAAGSAADDE